MNIRAKVIGIAVGVMCAIAFQHGYSATKQNTDLKWNDTVVTQEDDPSIALTNTMLYVKGSAVEIGLNNRTLLNLSSTVNSWQTYWNGTNSWLEVTNYMHTVAGVIPEFSIHEIRDGTNRVVWSDIEKFDAFVNAYKAEIALSKTQTVNQVMQQVSLAVGEKADKAWSLYQSGTGLVAPSNTTWISTPRTVIAGGLDYERRVDTYGEVWILVANGMCAQFDGVNTNGCFSISDGDGNTMFSIKKTASYTVGASANSINVNQGTIELDYNVVSATHPSIYKTTELGTTFTDIDSTVTWSGQSGAWHASIPRPTGESKGFYRATYVVEGENIIEQSIPVKFTTIVIGNQKYGISAKTVSGELVLGLTPAN